MSTQDSAFLKTISSLFRTHLFLRVRGRVVNSAHHFVVEDEVRGVQRDEGHVAFVLVLLTKA